MREWKPQDIPRIAGGYWTACALHAAVHLDMFSALHEGPLSVADIARATSCDMRGTDLLCTALCALGLMRRESGTCVLTAFARQYLCRQSSDYMGYIIQHQRHLVPAWHQLDEAVRHGTPVRRNSSSMQNSESERENFLMGMYNVANAQAGLIVPHIDLSTCTHLLDLGGGPGTYAVRFCQHNAHVRATVFDLPTTAPFAGKIIAQHCLEDRVTFVGGDFMRDPLPKECDVVWISQILHALGPDEARALLTKAVQAATPGACLYIQEFVVDDDRNGPEFPALFGLNMLVGTGHGQSYTVAEITAMLHAIGVHDIQRLDMNLPQNCGIVRAVT